MLLPLAYYDHPILRKKALPVEKIDDSIKQFVSDMIETMHHNNGAGLAAPQVFRSLAMFVTHIAHQDEEGNWLKGQDRVYINPKILWLSDASWIVSEGCLSIPGLYEEVARPTTIRIEATDLEGEQFQEELHGWEARAFLHENDHLNGVLFIDRVKGKKRKDMDYALRVIKNKYNKSK